MKKVWKNMERKEKKRRKDMKGKRTKIYSHLLTDCFVISQLFSMARNVGGLKLGSKHAQLYVRLSNKPLGQRAYNVS